MSLETTESGAIVIGAGVVGAAVAQRLSQSFLNVLVLEAFDRPAEGITSRNSGVIHSGIYYEPRSLKARLCVRGQELLYDWCASHEVPHRKTGKLMVALRNDELEDLEHWYGNAVISGARGMTKLSRKELERLTPGVRAIDGWLATETGIVDAAALTHSLLRSAEQSGAQVIYRSKVTGAEPTKQGYRLHTSRGEIDTKRVVNCAGLGADIVANLLGERRYQLYPCRGDYFRFRTREKFETLVYPVKRRNAAGLGIHLTIGLDGDYRLGPDAEYVASRDDYSPRPEKLEKFRKAAQELFGPIDPRQLAYDQCGIRPKLRGPKDPGEVDFVVSQDLPGWVNLLGIESPGLTASLALAEHVERILSGEL